MQSRPSDLPEHTPPESELSESSSSRRQAPTAQRHLHQHPPGPPEPSIPRPSFPRPAHPQQQLQPQQHQQQPPPPPPPSLQPQVLQPTALAHLAFPPTTSSTTSSPAKRRRTSFGSSSRDLDPDPVNVPTGAPSSSSTTTTARPPLLNPAPAVGGSSRDANAEMHRSSTPPDTSSTGAIKYTRTGRVSKATKGQRVHHCDECGKTYTRAEHLRRHQQNHKPGAYPCDVPGCDRSFYREDLLVRHKARHNDPQNPPSRRQSVGSEMDSRPRPIPPPMPAEGLPSLSRPTPAPPAPLPHTQPPAPQNGGGGQPQDKRGPPRVPVPPYQLPVGVLPSSLDGNGHGGWQGQGMFFDGSSPTSPSGPGGYESPDQTPPLPYWSLGRGRNPSSASVYGYLPDGPPASVRSPVSAASSNAYPSPLCSGMTRPPAVMFGVCEGAVAQLSPYNYGSSYLHGSGFGYDPHQSQAGYRDAQERPILSIPEMMPSTPDFHRRETDSNEGQYLEAYWNCIHPFFPIVHKPTFHAASASPLLRAAMAALGGQALRLREREHLSNARIIHERCMKVLRMRDIDHSHTWRIPDMQAIVLIEVYCIFRSRRPPLQLSGNFEEVYSRLMDDSQLWDARTSDDDARYPGGGRQLEKETRQRLLLACYTLDQQHATLFGRMQTERCYGLDLPFPSAQAQWDSSDDTPVDFGHWRDSTLTHYEHVSDAIGVVPGLATPSLRPHDTFQSLVMVACLVDPTLDVPVGESVGPSGGAVNTLSHAIEQTTWTRLAFHTLELCKQTPVRDLLAVAGESWVMAEKLSTADAYTKAQLELRHWAMGSSTSRQTAVRDVRRALSHAFSILDIVHRTPRTGLLFQEWAVYLASVVIWAQQYVLAADARQPPSSPVNPQGAMPAQPELHQKMRPILQNGIEGLSGWRDTRTILMWTKRQMETTETPHTCGLISGALDVLRKLIIQGNEANWF